MNANLAPATYIPGFAVAVAHTGGEKILHGALVCIIVSCRDRRFVVNLCARASLLFPLFRLLCPAFLSADVVTYVIVQ